MKCPLVRWVCEHPLDSLVYATLAFLGLALALQRSGWL